MDYSFDRNSHNSTTTLKYQRTNSSNPNSLFNNNIGNVSIGKNHIPSAPFVYKNVSPPLMNGFPFYNRK